MEMLRDILSRVSIGPLICLALGGLLGGVALLWLASHWLSAPRWATAEGQVVQSRVSASTRNVQRRGSGARASRTETRYRADIVYRYRVGGRDYTGHGIGDGENWNYWSHDGAAAALAPYNRGRVTVYYDPADPARAALNTNIFGIVPLILGGVGLPLLGFGFWWYRSRRPEAEG